MTTKDSLKKAQESINTASLKLRQQYSNSPSSRKVFFIVEGKDDVPYYGTKYTEYKPDGWQLSIIPAGNRKKVIDTYQEIDWNTYDKRTIAFFIDRDLSDFTEEFTPTDTNVYVTSKYAIENDLCTRDTFITALKYYYGLNELTNDDKVALLQFYDNCWNRFSAISEILMAQILCWKQNHTPANYASFKIQNIFEIKEHILQPVAHFSSESLIINEFFRQSGVVYAPTDISIYRILLTSKHTSIEFVRGKYILAFFVKALIYVSKNSVDLLPSRKRAIDTLGVGYEDALTKLCGIMKTPETLRIFFLRINSQIISM